MNNIERALLVAEKAHATQSYDIYPYIYHPRQIMNIAIKLGFDESIIIACILHDVLEDTDLSFNDIKKGFGEEVAEIVYCVTDELGRNRKERKSKTYPKIRNNWKSTIVKMCDRCGNMEHSKKYSPSLFKMYLKEDQDFRKQIFNAELSDSIQLEIQKAWDYLDIIMEIK